MDPDKSRAFIDIHVISETIETIQNVEGKAYWLNEDGVLGHVVRPGDGLYRDALIFIEPGASIEYERGRIDGGRRGRTHSFVDPESIRGIPTRDDVPKLLDQLSKMKSQPGLDPLEAKFCLKSEFDVRYSREFALVNLDLVAARGMPESTARSLGVICLFLAGESACVAMSHVDLSKIHATMTALKRPVLPHLVDDDTLNTLLTQTYIDRP